MPRKSTECSAEYIYYTRGNVTHKLLFYADNTWAGFARNVQITTELLGDVASKPVTHNDYRNISEAVRKCQLCSGNTDLDAAASCTVMLKIRCNRTVRCQMCANAREAMLLAQRRKETADVSARIQAKSRTPLSALSPQELKQRASNLGRLVDSKNTELARCKDKIKRLSNKQSISLAHNSDVNKLVHETVVKAEPKFDSEFKQLFWQQQVKQNSLKCKTAMRWHPMMIRWALTLNSITGAGYDYVRESGALDLPHANTLRKYICFKEKSCGILNENIDMLKSKLKGNADVALMHDEIKVKDKLVYNRANGELIGFVELGDINTAFHNIESEPTDTSTVDSKQIASHALCFMARSLTSKNCLPVAQFATNSLTADQLFNMFWEVVGALETEGIHVRCSISDGAATNRKFYMMHSNDFPEDPVVHRCINTFTEDTEHNTLYFVSDVPHLLKTTRNCVENSHGHNNTRNLVVS